ncbi:MAG: methyltransferase domain-containing protein [Pirellulales bacterium]|jgi:SAM-dependent methyltransferase
MHILFQLFTLFEASKMDNIDAQVDRHYGKGQIMEQIKAGLQLAGKDLNALEVDDLAPIDAFHTRGRESTLELATLANVSATDLVLDVGSGLGGTARHLAEVYQCKVTGIDLTEEYVAVGKKLTEMVGLSELVNLQQGSALDIPCEDASFDLVWTEHVQMNIADKQKFYSEIA